MVTHRQAKVRVVNESGQRIEPNSIVIAHKYSDVYKNELKFPNGLDVGSTDDAGGSMIVDYHTGFLTTGVDWWLVSWVTADDAKIHMTTPQNLTDILDWIQENLTDAIAEATTIGGGILGPPGAVVTAAAVGLFMNKVMNTEKVSNFKMFMLQSEDEGAWVTIRIKNDNVLTFEAPSGNAETQHHVVN